MFISKIQDKTSFGNIRLYHISHASKTGKFLQQAAKEAVNAKEIKNLEKKGMIFDFVRVFDFEGKKTNQVQFFLSRKPDYATKDGLIPIKNVISKIESLSDAKQFVSTVIEKSKNFLPEHLNYVKKYFANGGEIEKRTTIAKMENTVIYVAAKSEETSRKGINAIRKSVYKNYGKADKLDKISKDRKAKTNKLIAAQIKQNRENGIQPIDWSKIFDKHNDKK